MSDKQLRWPEVADALRERSETHPGHWLRVRGDAPTESVARAVIAGRVDALDGMDVETFTRRAKPRADDSSPGWEIYLRLRG